MIDKRPNTRRILALALCAWLAVTAATGSRAEQLYDIELVVFKNLIRDDGGERWGHGPRSSPLPAAASEPSWLPASEQRLGPHYYSLRSSANYRPLARFAWRQAVGARGRADTVRLPPTGDLTAGSYVEGSARVAVERYLHLDLDLTLHEPPAAGPDTASSGEPPPVTMREQRRMRSKELHYFDNPRFGVLALITPYLPEGAQAGAGGGEEPPAP